MPTPTAPSTPVAMPTPTATQPLAPTPTLIPYGIILFRDGIGSDAACYPLSVFATPWVIHWETVGEGALRVTLRDGTSAAAVRDVVDVALAGVAGEQGQVVIDDLVGSFCFTVVASPQVGWGMHFGLPQ